MTIGANVRFFRSSDAGAPQGGHAAGLGIGILDACLITGYGTVILTSLTVTAGLATATVDAGHNFTEMGLQGVTIGPVIRLAGATGAGASVINDDHRITITSVNQFTFPASGASGAITGVITARLAPLDWSKAFSGTNKAVYRSSDVTARRDFLRVDDPGYSATPINDLRNRANVIAYYNMTDVDTGDVRYPPEVANTYYWFMASANSASIAGEWFLIGDGKTFWYFMQVSSGVPERFVFSFGDGVLIDESDPYHGVLIPTRYFGGYSSLWSATTNPEKQMVYMANNPDGQTPGAEFGTEFAGNRVGGSKVWPGDYGGRFVITPVAIAISGSTRGLLRGLYNGAGFSPSSVGHGRVVFLQDRCFVYQVIWSIGGCFLEVSDWAG